MGALFDYQTLAERLAIPADQLAELARLVRDQYGRDEMMAELRMLRTLQAIEGGELTLGAVLAEFRASVPAPLRAG